MDEEKDYKGESFCGTLCFFIAHSTREMCRRVCHFVISVLSCYLAITVALVANTTISNSPLLFLRMSEISQGEIDLSIWPARDTSSYVRFLDSVKMDSLVGNAATLAPRIIFPNAGIYDQDSTKQVYNLMVFDTEREKKAGIGRKFDSPELGEGECAIHEDIASKLGVNVGDELSLSVGMGNYLNIYYVLHELIAAEDLEDPEAEIEEERDTEYEFKCKVASMFDSLKGKLPSDDEDVYFYMELKHFLKSISAATPTGEIVRPPLDFLKDEDPYKVVTEVNSNHPNRMEIYKDNDYDNIKKELVVFVEAILDKLGFFPVSSHMPILEDLESYSMAAVFLGIVMNLVVIVLAAISSYLIYSLLMISFDTRMFEMGIFRVIGIRKYALCLLVFVQALLFVLPALIIGIGTSFLYLWIISNIFDNRLQFSFRPVPSGGAFIWAICVGFIVPLLAALIPMFNVLDKSLSESIDMEHSKSQGVHITIEYATNKTNWSLVVFGLIIIAFGLLVYYMLPLSILLMDYQLMLWIFIIVLLAMFIGLIMIAMNIHHLIELFIIYIILFLETAYMKMVIAKNLIAHRIRNQRTGTTFSVVIGFLMFVIVAYTLELENARLTMLRSHGGYLRFHLRRNRDILTFRDIIRAEQVLAKHKDKLEGFVWTPQELQFNPYLRVREAYASDYAVLNSFRTIVVPISPQFFEVTSREFLTIEEKNDTSDLSLAEQLYTPRGSQAMGLGSYLKRELGLSVNNPNSTFLLRFSRLTDHVVYESRPLFMLKTCPYLTISRLTRSWQNGAISYPLFLKFTNFSSTSLLLYRSLIVKVKDNKNSYLDEIAAELKKVADEAQSTTRVWSYSESAEDIDSVNGFLDIIFSVIIILFMLLFAFSLISSMTANVLEQVKELAVLRSIGMTKGRAAILYMYEAFVLVLTSGIIGTIIGTLVGFTLCLQRSLYTDLPVTFTMPWIHLVVIVAGSLLCAAISSISPAILILTHSIALLAKS